MTGTPKRIGILGGAGKEGSGLGLRWSLAGHDVMLGSRNPARAISTANSLCAMWNATSLRGTSNAEAALADIVVLSVPYPAKAPLLTELKHSLAGKLVIDLTVPLVPPRVSNVQLPSAGSGAVETRHLLPDGTRLVAAFHNVSAEKLVEPGQVVDCDVLVCGDDQKARAEVVDLAADAGLRGIEAGPLVNAAAAEGMTSVLIWINRNYKVPGAGIKITGLR